MQALVYRAPINSVHRLIANGLDDLYIVGVHERLDDFALDRVVRYVPVAKSLPFTVGYFMIFNILCTLLCGLHYFYACCVRVKWYYLCHVVFVEHIHTQYSRLAT